MVRCGENFLKLLLKYQKPIEIVFEDACNRLMQSYKIPLNTVLIQSGFFRIVRYKSITIMYSQIKRAIVQKKKRNLIKYILSIV